MRNQFNLDHNQNCSKPRRFAQTPQWLLDITKKDNSVIFISSLDPDITITKIKDVSPATQIIDYKQLLLLASSSTLSGHKATHAIICNRKLEEILTLASAVPSKIICVTGQDISGIFSRAGQVPVVADRTNWKDLSPFYQNQIRTQLLRTFGRDGGDLILNSIKEQDTATGLLSDKEKEEIIVDLINGNKPNLFKDTIPARKPFYVPRRIISRKRISPSTLSTNSTDVFLFYGIQKQQLSSLVGGNTDTSDKQIVKSKLTSRFIILIQPSHFDKICNLTTHSVHLLLYNVDGSLTWLKSDGDISSMQLAMDTLQEIVDEEAFISSLEENIHIRRENEPICISNKAGMGKTVLLAQMGRRLQDKYPERLVIFMEINQLISDLQSDYVDGSTLSREIVEYRVEKFVCANELARALFQTNAVVNNDNITLEILLDGFDEINRNHVEFACEILSVICSIKSVRMWVTTRPQYLDLIEKRLLVLGHNIQAYDRDDQTNFLKTYWKTNNNLLNDEKLGRFATSCLDELEKTMRHEVNNIAGLPLQCRLIGDVYEGDAVEYSQTPGHTTPVLTPASISDLFEKFIERRLEIFSRKHSGINIDKEKLRAAHVDLGITLLFPDARRREKPDTSRVSTEQLLKIGILESLDNPLVPKFIHRTFAEHFVARFAIDTISRHDARDATSIRLLFSMFECRRMKTRVYTILSRKAKFRRDEMNYDDCRSQQFIHSILCYFIDSQLERLENFNFPNMADFVETDFMENVALACLQHGFENILKFLDSSGWLDNKLVYDKNAVFLTAKQGTLDMLKVVCQRFNENNKHRVASVKSTAICHGPLPVYVITPLHVAVIRGDYAIVDYLLHTQGFEKKVGSGDIAWRELLLPCVQNSLNDSENMVSDKVEIIKRIVEISRSKVNNLVKWWYNSPLIEPECRAVHPTLLGEMVKLDVYKPGSKLYHYF